MAVKLTSLSHGAGCGCKLGAAELAAVLDELPVAADPALLVGHRSGDDAGVYRLRDDLAIVQTVDFFTPIVDDPYDFGRIAATNALSDIYAMGATPVTALNLVAFSLQELGEGVLRAILRGGAEVAAAAGVAVVGGHSIDDREPKYGMAVTGVAHPDEVIANAGGRPGDALILTKPLGVGAISTALKRGLADDRHLAAAVEVMLELNRDAAAAAARAGVHAMTDVTGYGLLGHLHELALASEVAAEVDAGAVPAIPGALELLEDEAAVSGGAARNAADAGGFASVEDGVPAARRRLLSDPMTSGGLLVALAPETAAQVPGAEVGRLVEGEPGRVAIRT